MKKAKLEEKKDLQNKKLYKSFDSEIKAESADGRRTVVARITTPSLDRSKDHVNPKGIRTDNFMKNPVVLFAHKYDELPVAKCTGLQSSDTGILATVEFPEEGRYAKSDLIYWMCQNNYLSATSIGFMPDNYEINKDGGHDFISSELFEFSFVPVPDQPEALLVMRSKGIDVDKAFEDMRGKELPEDFVIEKEAPGEEDDDDPEEKEIKEAKEETTKRTEADKETKEAVKTEEVKAEEKSVEEHKEANDSPADAPISGLTVGQLKDLLADAVKGFSVDKTEKSVDTEAKKVEDAVLKDVQEVLMLSDVLSALSWVIWVFEGGWGDEDDKASQSSVDKLNQALGIILQVVAEQAVLGEKSFKLSELPKGKDAIKIVAKAGRTISGKHEDMLKSACDHMTKAAEQVNGVLESVGIDNEPDEDNEKASDDALEKIANAVTTNNRKTDSVAKKQNETLSLLEKIASEIGGEKK